MPEKYQREEILTLAFYASSIDTCAPHKHIVYYRKHTFTAYPPPIFVFDLAIVENGGLVQLHTSTMYSPGEGNLIRVKILPA